MSTRVSYLKFRQSIITFSPFLVIGIGQLSIRLLAPIFGVWSWAPFWLVYISTLGCFIALDSGQNQAMKWLEPPQGSWGWGILAIVIPVAMTLPIFIPNWRLLLASEVWLSTLFFIAINPVVEEFYWRGVVLDSTTGWPRWLSVAYAVTGFALHHLWLGVLTVAGRHPSALIGPVVMGLIWAVSYLKTRSLRWSIAGHFLVNVFSLSVPVFLNLYTPPSFPGS